MKNKKTEEEILKENGLACGLFDKDGNLVEPKGTGMIYDAKTEKWRWVDSDGKVIN